MLNKHLYKKTVPEIFDFLVSFVPSDISVPTQNTGGQENRNSPILLCNSPICWKKTN